MCLHAEKDYKPHFVCLGCRVSFKRPAAPPGWHRCPNCRRP